MQVERPRARRYPFAASIELFDLHSEAEINVNALKPWALGTKVRLRIACRGAVFTALGQVANVHARGGMGVVFSKIEEKDQLVLEKWIAEARHPIRS